MRGDVSCIRSLFLELLQLVSWHSSEGKPYTGLTVLQEERLDLGKAHMDHTQCTQHWPQGPQQLHTALAPGSSTAAHSTGPRALNSCTQHWPQGPQQLHTALAPGPSTAAHSTGPRVLNSCTQHWPQGPQQLHTALAPGSSTAAHCNKQVSLWSRKGRQLQPSSSAMVSRKCHTSS